MEFVSAIIGPIVESVMIPVKKQLSYLFSSRKHVRNMSTRMEHLDGTSLDVRKHMEENIINNLEIPTCVPGWLEKVEKVKNDAHSISSITGNNGCFNMKMRYRSGRNAFKITEDIESLTQENRDIILRDTQKPLGKVKSKKASASASLGNDSQNYFKSREKTFNNALKFLQQDHTSQVIALCGMGGVGKTTMMEQLKRTAEDKNMFDWIVKVVIGQKINMLSIQQTVADYLGQPVTETSKAARADRLRIRFGNMSEQKKKVLVILDDLWEMIALQDMGLSPLPNGFKVLLTSRYENICKQIAVEANSNISLVSVDVMDELEAHNFFCQITGVSEEYNQELNQIGSDIVRRCGFLPLAIKLIATTLKFQEKFVWRDTLHRLKKKNLDRNVQEIIEISYTYIKEEEEKAIFLLCGLFPDDFNIPIEELTRYAWGLQLLNDVSTLGDARDRTKTCVQNIKNASLLIDSDYNGCVKMHDLVLAYVLGRVSKGDHPWIINHGDISEWSIGMHESCKRISITCSGMSEFPGDSKYPNLSLLRLMNGDKLLKFPEDCYDRMENLEVIGFEKMQYPLLPRSLQFSTKLRTLILHQCLLMFDCSAIGELVNLEVLSFANCGITKLPSTIGKLKELKLLDLTGCVNLRIDDGVLRNLVKLEELYMRAVDGKFIRFTDENRDELAECSKHLSALEFEFFENNGKPESMLFADLQRFKISMGRGLGYNIDSEKHSFKNTLKLATNKDELLDSRMNELFGKTEVLYLEVGGMNDIEEILVDSVHLPMHLFNNLKDLDVSKCENLKYLFIAPMTSGLMKLERLRVSKCPVLEVLVYGEDGGAGVIKFQELKFLSLAMLPKLVGFCNTVNVLELPQLVDLRLKGLPNFTSIYPENLSATSSMSTNDSDIQPFLKKEVLIPKLNTLWVHSMNKLKEIWPEQFNSSDEGDACILRNIQVEECDNIVNLFPTNPMLLLRHLEILRVKTCRSIEVFFNIDMRSVSEIKEYSSNLRHIYVSNLGKLRELWRMKGESSYDILIRSCQTVEYIEILCCESFANISTPTLTNSDVGILLNVSIDGRRPWEERRRNTELIQKSQEISVISKEKSTKVYSNIPDVAFQKISHKSLKICGSKGVNVVFEVESSCSRDLITTQHNQQPLLLPCINELWLCQMETMSQVWKCKLNKHVIPPNQSFHNLTTITLQECKSIKYLFSPLIGKLLTNLKKVSIYNCEGIEEIVSNRYDDNDEVITSISAQTNTMFCIILKASTFITCHA